MPAAVHPVSGAVVEPAPILGWAPGVVQDAVRRRWSVPVVVENDARAGAVGESRGAAETLVHVKLSMGIGCGVVVGGAVLRGAGGLAGDIGHVRVGPPGGPRCRCGRTGCLAAYASGRALLEQLVSARWPTWSRAPAVATPPSSPPWSGRPTCSVRHWPPPSPP